MKTIKELTKLNTGKELNINYPIRLYDKAGRQVYCEDSEGDWQKWVYEDGYEVYFENSKGFWSRRECEDGVEVYYEDSDGCIEDNREPVDMTIAEVRKELGKNIRIVG